MNLTFTISFTHYFIQGGIIINTAILLIIIIGLFALVSTSFLGGKGDKNYDKATKGNIFRLSWIYIILGIGVVIAFAIYLF
jgi:hypothetical protein